ncbi:MAG TPA: ATP-binding protein [Tepidisphaeraceae bacterium]|jgi:signal transduction histidine kinase|nr:ATP-binding protein [Tepidisphaeraceae bacterium]HEV8604153.1 ATP-binding protein [Tepidisphaeraceae bacterium]
MSVAEISSAGPAQRIEELGRIILAYSEVTEKLQQSHERLEQTVAALREELGEKNRMLERKNRLAALGEMAAGMAHEIRNPLGGIQLYASMLAGDVTDRPQSFELAQKIGGCVRRLEGLVSRVLHFAREMNVQIVECDLAEVVDDSLSLAGGAIVEKSIHFSTKGPRSMMVSADPLMLGQALLNLILNAVQASGKGGTVVVEYGVETSEGRQFRLAVEDGGPGIRPEIMDKIFDPFFTTKDEGTGLGLAIVHRVVEAHEGVISASNRDGGGARFEIRI